MKILLVLLICLAGASAFSNIDDKIIQEYGKIAVFRDCFGDRIFKHYVKKVKAAVATCFNKPFQHSSSPASDQGTENQKVDIMFDREHVHELSIKMRLAVSNSSCVQQQLGYIDDEYNILYQNIVHDIKELGRFDKWLMEQLLNGITLCRDFTTCVPLDKIQYPMGPAEMKYLNFKNCWNQATLGSCLKKQFRERPSDYDYIGAQNIFDSSSADEKMISLIWRDSTSGLF